jgi:hypothetical protein
MGKWRGFVSIGVLGIGLTVTGCQPVHAPLMGVLYLDVKGPITATAAGGTREGKACAQSILGMVATGDASIDAAKKAGGITEVSSVDHSSNSVLGITAEFCTIVHGK